MLSPPANSERLSPIFMHFLTRYIAFEASHFYRIPELNDQENYQLFGHKANPNGHGHNYALYLTVKGSVDPVNGMVLNIKKLDDTIRGYVDQHYDHKQINLQHPVFAVDPHLQPTPENIVMQIWQAFNQRLKKVEIAELRLDEDERLYTMYYGVEQMVHLTRTYEFSAAHRLHSFELSDQENSETFGKCNNPNGHGHNYVLEVTISGEVDSRTGMVVKVDDLDRIIDKQVYGRFDHKHLNLDTVEFQSLNPTSENFVQVLWDLLVADIRSLDPARSVQLYRLRLRETPKSFFDYYGN